MTVATRNVQKTHGTVNHNQFSFTWKSTTQKHNAYWCKNHRRLSCRAKLKILHGGQQVEVSGHSDSCKLENSDLETVDVSGTNLHIDHKVYMTKKVQELALQHLAKKPREIWGMINKEMSEKFAIWSGLKDSQVVNLVKNERAKDFGGDVFLN